MARNKLIYATADHALIVSADYNKGGTWAGAEEELKRKNSIPVFVRIGSEAPAGNTKLLALSAIPWPDSMAHSHLEKQLQDLAFQYRQAQPKSHQTQFDFESLQVL